MMRHLARRVGYSRAEYLSDVVVHLVGTLTVIATVPVLIVLAVFVGQGAAPVTGATLYGLVFALMITLSALYNIFPHPEWEWLLKRLDHAAIYLKIAGTFTALSLIQGTGNHLVAAIWAVALLGIALKMLCPYRYRAVGLALYVGLGLFAGIAAEQIFLTLPGLSIWLLTWAGVFYLVGVGFYLWSGLRFHFTIWHLIVLTASLMVYAGVLLAVITP